MVIIVPPHEELSSVITRISCPEEDCDSIFHSSSNLQMHLIRHHKKSKALGTPFGANPKFACPADTCIYGVNTGNYFTKMKALKQHYLKCHAEKAFSCKNCPKSFATLCMLTSHSKVCGLSFVCSCGWTYNSKEALSTHCKRKNHHPAKVEKPIREDKKTVNTGTLKERDKDAEKREENALVKVCFASPPRSKSPRKPNNDGAVFPTHYIAAIALSELSTTFIIPKYCHIGVQTTDFKITKKRSLNDKKRKSSQETQTSTNEIKKQKICAETQTRTHVKRIIESKPTLRQRKKSIETQTKDPMLSLSGVESESMDCGIFNESSLSNSSISNEHSRKPATHGEKSYDDDTVWDDQSYNKDSQESKPFINEINSKMLSLNNGARSNDLPLRHFSNFDITKLCSIETQTEIDNLLADGGETSTTETQTTNDHIEDDEDLLYSNMCTQTCGDFSDILDYDFADIETQTAWPDL